MHLYLEGQLARGMFLKTMDNNGWAYLFQEERKKA